MNLAIPTLFEFVIVLLIAPVLSSNTYRLVIYGFARRAVLFLVASIVVCGTLNVMYYSQYRQLAKPEAERMMEIVNQPVMRSRSGNVSGTPTKRVAARYTFLANGTYSDYPSPNGELVRFAPTELEVQWRADALIALARQNDAAAVAAMKSAVWGLLWIPLLLTGYLLSRREFKKLTDKHGFQRITPQTTFADIDGFVSMLLGACEDANMHGTLEQILSQPNDKRKLMVNELLAGLRDKRAPKMLIDGFVCLLDDDVAEKAYVAIHKCAR